MKVARMSALAVAGAATGLTVLMGAGPALADEPAGTTSTVDVSAKAKVKATWRHSVRGAYSSGSITSTQAKGTVRDTASDGRCAYVRIAWYRGGRLGDVDTVRACGYKKGVNFLLRPGDGPYWRASSARVYTWAA